MIMIWNNKGQLTSIESNLFVNLTNGTTTARSRDKSIAITDTHYTNEVKSICGNHQACMKAAILSNSTDVGLRTLTSSQTQQTNRAIARKSAFYLTLENTLGLFFAFFYTYKWTSHRSSSSIIALWTLTCMGAMCPLCWLSMWPRPWLAIP